MAAYVTTNIPSSSYVAPSANGNNYLAITSGGTTYKFNNVPYPDNSNELVAVGKSVFGTGNAQMTVLSAVYKQATGNGNPTYSFFVGKVESSSIDPTVIWPNAFSGITQVGFLECMVGIDLDNNGSIGPSGLTVLSQTINNTTVTDLGDQVLAKDSSGMFYVLDKTTGTDNSHNVNSVKVGSDWYDAVLVREQGSNFQAPYSFDWTDSFNNKNSSKAVAVVKSASAPPSEGYSPPNQGNAAGYYVAIKRTNDGQTKAQWEIRKINFTGEIDYSNQVNTEKNFQIRRVLWSRFEWRWICWCRSACCHHR